MGLKVGDAPRNNHFNRENDDDKKNTKIMMTESIFRKGGWKERFTRV
jgi:hypothetical protein